MNLVAILRITVRGLHFYNVIPVLVSENFPVLISFKGMYLQIGTLIFELVKYVIVERLLPMIKERPCK